MKNDNEGVGAPSGPRVLASRSLWPECYRGDLANSKILGRDVAVWNFAPEELRGLDRDGFDVALDRGLPSTEISKCAPITPQSSRPQIAGTPRDDSGAPGSVMFLQFYCHKIVPAPLVIEAVPKAPPVLEALILRLNANAEIAVPS